MKTRKLIIRVLVLTLALAMLLVAPAAASSKKKKTINKKALKAYKKVLEKGYYTYSSYGYTWRMELDEFTLIDINRDGIKEMITQKDRYGTKTVWAFKGKKAKRIHTFGTFQGTSVGYSKRNKAITYAISMTVGTDADGFFRLKSRTGTNRFEYGSQWSNEAQRMVPHWYVNGKEVSEKSFKNTAKMKSMSDMKTVLFYRNTKANRKKMKKLKAY